MAAPDPTPTYDGGGRGRRRRTALLTLLAIAVLAGAGAAFVAVDPAGVLARAPVVGDTCPSSRLPTTAVSVVAAPDISPVVEQVVSTVDGRELPDGRCLEVTVSSQRPADTVAGAQIAPLDRAPDLWIPDSSLWLGRVEQWEPTPIARFASSPVVIGTSTAVVADLGWAEQPPTWDAALGGSRPVAAPNIAQDAAGLSAELALFQVLGKGEKAQTALAGAVLAGLRADAPTRESAVAIAQTDAADAPLIPLTEQAVSNANSETTDPKLVAVYPRGGLPSLDYPVTRIEGSDPTTQERTATRAVADALASPATRATVRAAGFRDTGGSTSDAPGIVPAAVTPMEPPSPAEVEAVVTRIVLLSAPSRIQVVIDMSGSMNAPAGKGMTRSAFAAAAAATAGRVMPDVAQVGLWGFARDLRGKADRVEIREMSELGARTGGVAHRDAVTRDMQAMTRRLGGNGTALYATAIDAMRYMRGLYDPRAGNAVVLFTDGLNVDPGGPSLKTAVREIRKLYDPARPVRLICIGIGAEADLDALEKLAAAGGGEAFRARDPGELPEVLFTVMSRRPAS
jgi:hypothetical protein